MCFHPGVEIHVEDRVYKLTGLADGFRPGVQADQLDQKFRSAVAVGFQLQVDRHNPVTQKEYL